MTAARWKRLALWWVVVIAILAVFALTMPVGRDRLAAGAIVGLILATVIALYDRPDDGRTSDRPTV